MAGEVADYVATMREWIAMPSVEGAWDTNIVSWLPFPTTIQRTTTNDLKTDNRRKSLWKNVLRIVHNAQRKKPGPWDSFSWDGTTTARKLEVSGRYDTHTLRASLWKLQACSER
jgi:hypothetical protein